MTSPRTVPDPSSTDLRQLAAFLAVRRHASFTRAADELDLPQPAVSRLVGRLEARLGVVLFERSSHHVQITAIGDALAADAQHALDAVTRFDASVARLRGDGVLRVGTTEGAGLVVRGLLERFASAQPGTEVRLEPDHTPRKLTRLLQGSLDVAFVRNPPPTSGLRFAAVATQPLVAAVARTHPLAGQDAVTFAQLAPYPLMATPEVVNPGVHHAVMAMLERAGVTPALGAPLLNQGDGLAQIAVSRAWTLLTAAALRGHEDDVVAVTLADPEAVATISLAWRPGAAAPATRAFVALATGAR